MANVFKNINYRTMLFSTVRRYFALNTAGIASIFYNYLTAFTDILQTQFNSFVTWRNEKFIIANCKYQIGQLTNVLNYFFDPVNNGIYIDQALYLQVFIPDLSVDPSIVFVPDLSVDPSTVFLPTFNNTMLVNGVIIHVPNAYIISQANHNRLVSVIEQIKITGLNYTLVSL